MDSVNQVFVEEIVLLLLYHEVNLRAPEICKNDLITGSL